MAPAYHSNASQDAFNWNTPIEHAYHSPRRQVHVADILEASATSKMKVEQSTSAEQTTSLNLSTSIDTKELEELTPTRVQPPRSTKRQRTWLRRRMLITTDSDDESSESLAF
ncbi:hypothetical protein V6N13_008123 [Hibiscus sabdariffa]